MDNNLYEYKELYNLSVFFNYLYNDCIKMNKKGKINYKICEEYKKDYDKYKNLSNQYLVNNNEN
jgi:hypothetical protein